MAQGNLCFLTATELAERIRTRKVTCRAVMEAHWAQIERVNPQVNAIVTRIPQAQALTQADAADRALAAGKPVACCTACPWP